MFPNDTLVGVYLVSALNTDYPVYLRGRLRK